MEGCREWEGRRGSWQKNVGRILGEEREGKEWMRDLERERQWMEGEGREGRRNKSRRKGRMSGLEGRGGQG